MPPTFSHTDTRWSDLVEGLERTPTNGFIPLQPMILKPLFVNRDVFGMEVVMPNGLQNEGPIWSPKKRSQNRQALDDLDVQELGRLRR